MINVLITGSRGFLGTALRNDLSENTNIRVLEFCRSDPDNLLHEYIKIADFIFHFAGEVRPKSSDDAFYSSNSGLTEKLVTFLSVENKQTPLVMTSTIHAINPKNSYGFSKLESERLVENYSKTQGASAWIYRLPHVFGPGCKPNYNSVLTTWIYNSIHDLDINVFDRNIQMNYCYSLDLIGYFKSHIAEEASRDCFCIIPQNIYNTTLGKVVDHIERFKHSDTNLDDSFVSGSFEEKMYFTYQSYAINK